jgi:preprotein translocase subunit SecY
MSFLKIFLMRLLSIGGSLIGGIIIMVGIFAGIFGSPIGAIIFIAVGIIFITLSQTAKHVIGKDYYNNRRQVDINYRNRNRW